MIRMVLVQQAPRFTDEFQPQVFCDMCGQRVFGREGNILWQWNTKANTCGPLYFAHKRCTRLLEARYTQADHRWMSGELTTFPGHCATNLAHEDVSYQDGTYTVRKALIQRDGRLCHYCGQEVLWPEDIKAQLARLEPAQNSYRDEARRKAITRRAMTIDHKIPQIQGGSDQLDNLVLACSHCNSSKHDGDYEDFCMMARPFKQFVHFVFAEEPKHIIVRRSRIPENEWGGWYCLACKSLTCPHVAYVLDTEDRIIEHLKTTMPQDWERHGHCRIVFDE